MLVAPTAAREEAPRGFSYDHTVCQCIKKLKQIPSYYRKRKLHNDPERTSLCQIDFLLFPVLLMIISL